nr:hypothetical protein [Tanacetum cinerariifolium]
TIATTIEQQVALDEALVPSTQRRSSEIYMQEFWATAYVHQYSIRFKMDSKKNIVDLETFRDMLHICPRVSGQSFDELPFEEKILDFLRFPGHIAQIRTLTDVNVNKLFQPWKSFAAVINKCLTGKSFGFDSFRHQNTQQYGALLPIELMNDEIRNTKAYKEYYACATGEAAPKLKTSARRKRSGLDMFITPPIAITTLTTTVDAAPRLTADAKGKQPAKAKSPTDPSEETHISQHDGSGTDEGTGSKPGVPDVPSDDSEEEISWNSSDDEETKEEESLDPIPRTPKDIEDDGNDEEDQGFKDGMEFIFTTASSLVAPLPTLIPTMTPSIITTITIASHPPIPPTLIPIADDLSEMELKKILIEKMEGNKSIQQSDEQRNLFSEEQRLIEEEEADELYRDVDINQGRGLQLSEDIEDSHVTLTLVNPDGQQESSSVSSQFVSSMLNPTSDALICFDDRLKSLEAHFSEYIQTNPFAEAVSNILDKTILDSYGETAILKRRREDDDDQEGPSAGSDPGSKRRRERGEPESASTPSEPTTRTETFNSG